MPTTVYPESLIGKYSNIKIVFLPKSTISHLQSLDAGIIKNFKVKYRKKLMRYVLARIVNDWNANETANGINVIRVIDWIKELGMKYPKTPLKIALQVVALWSNLLVLMTTNMPMKNLIISPKNYLRSCKTMATSRLTNIVISIFTQQILWGWLETCFRVYLHPGIWCYWQQCNQR